MLRTFAIALGFSTITSCASIVSKSSYPVTFDSNPTGANIVIRDGDGIAMYEGKAPTTLTLDSGDGYFGKASYQLEATMPGHNAGRATLTAGFDGWYVGNIVFGGLIGLLIVDPATGAMWKLDRRVSVVLGPIVGSED